MMLDTVNARETLLDFLSISCAITHEISTNGIGLSFFKQFHEKITAV
ncbi:RAxF-45 family protein [Chungangia koreensis]|uniref:RAxF-45 family protein n=1 Tax=Chungangia koreensis TaxID=752657 RepID=A0ABV8X4C2_9LACT